MVKENDNEYTDEYEQKTVELMGKLSKKNHRKNAILCREIADQIKKSKNPEAQGIYNFMFGMSKHEEAKAEKNPIKAVKLFDESLEYLSKSNGDNKSSDEYSETIILKLKKELEINKGNGAKCRALFLEIATEEKNRGNEKGHHMYMGLYHLYNGLKDNPRNPAKVLKEFALSAKSFEKAGSEQFKHKITGLRYRLLAYFQPTSESALSLLDKALKELEKTDDEVGLNEAKGSICYVSAMSETKVKQKVILFKQASEFYIKGRHYRSYHDAIGWSYLCEIQGRSIGIDKSIDTIKKAIRHFQKANTPSGLHKSKGFLFLLKAIKEGVIQKKDERFVKNLAQANYHFAKCHEGRYVNLTAGVVLFLESLKLPDEKSKDVLKKSAEILESINEDLCHLVFYQYYRIEAYSDIENEAYRVECQQNAVKHLEIWIESFDKFSPILDISCKSDFDTVKLFYQAEALYLRGMTESSSSKREHLLKSSIAKYDEINNDDLWRAKACYAKGWVFMFLFEFDKAHSAFTLSSKLNPKNKAIKKDIEFALDKLKSGFCDFKQMYKEEVRFSSRLQRSLAGEICQPSQLMAHNQDSQPGQDFYQSTLGFMQNAGMRIEENYPNHTDKGEEGLRDEMVQCLKMRNLNIAAESKKAKGKRDITVKDGFSKKELAAECLIWKGFEYFQSKKDQLFDRYLTWHDKEAVLITFVRNKNFIRILPKAEKAIAKLSGSIKGSFQSLSSDSHILYVSEHKHKSGTTVRLYHMFFHLPICD